jgi:hypothetical protein
MASRYSLPSQSPKNQDEKKYPITPRRLSGVSTDSSAGFDRFGQFAAAYSVVVSAHASEGAAIPSRIIALSALSIYLTV